MISYPSTAPTSHPRPKEPVLETLRQRKIVHWAAAYLAGAWVVYEVLTQVGDVFDWPSGLLRALTVLLGCGFPVTLVLAWYHGEKGRQRVSGPELLMLAALLLIAGTLTAMAGRSDTPVRAAGAEPDPVAVARPASHEASVAVLPFDNLTGDPRNDHVADGLTEEIISQLAQLEVIKVISRTSVEALKGSGLTLPRIADTLGVRHVLEGSVRRGQRGLRVTAQLIEAASDVHVWTERYERDVDDIVAAQEEIARQVSVALVPHVGPPREAASRTHDNAYDAYLQGRSLLRERTARSLAEAARAFETAITLDPEYAPAYAGLAAALGLSVAYDYTELPYPAVARALHHADHAIALDSTLGDGYAVRGWMLMKVLGPSEPILDDFRRALRYQPNSADVNGWYAGILTRERRYDEAMIYHERSLALDPMGPGRRIGLALDALGARRYDVAIEQAQKTLELSPRLPRALQIQALALVLLDRGEECAGPEYAGTGAMHAMCLRAIGRIAEADAVVDSIADDYVLGPRSAEAAASLATYMAWSGRVEEAAVWVEEAFARSPYGIDFRHLRTHAFDRARRDPTFASVLRRLETGLYDRATLGRRTGL